MSHLSAEALLGLSKQSRASLRLMLFRGEALRLPRQVCVVRAGAAWISDAGQDLQILLGETLTLELGEK